jgi:hypothetical protein
MDDVTLELSDADDGLRDRLNREIIAFNELSSAGWMSESTLGVGRVGAVNRRRLQ